MQNFTESDINRFFEEFKRLPDSYTIEKVHQLINNPYAKATLRMNNKLRPFKIIIMASAFITGITAVLLGLSPLNNKNPETGANQQCYTSAANTHGKKNSVIADTNENIINQNEVIIPDDKKPSIQGEIIKNPEAAGEKPDTVTGEYFATLPLKWSVRQTSSEGICTWPQDTVLDKNSMFVKLTDKEMEALGVFKRGVSYYYNNKTGSDNYIMRYNWTRDNPGGYNWSGADTGATQHKFTLKFTSDTACKTHRWEDPFYSQIDTLVPVLNYINNDLQVLWFTPHRDIFEALPKRYRYLEEIYANLKCLKQKNPNHRLVNYWSETRNCILDEINYLDLTDDELKNIGIQILDDGLNIYDPSNKYMYSITRGVTNITSGSAVPEIPTMFPAIITDIKGLKQNAFGDWLNQENISEAANIKDAFDTFIPVCLPLSRLVSNSDYDLIGWYYPSEEFINALPERFRNKIQGEIDYIKTGISNENSDCTYLEACKSTFHMEDLSVYPNPATGEINIVFSIDEPARGSISLVNISGAEVKILLPLTNFSKGENNVQANISGISQGIYLISIVTDKGFKTRRIIISG